MDSSSKSTVINISSSDVPKDYVTWSTFNTVFMNSCCLGFLAYVFSVKVSVLAVGVMGQKMRVGLRLFLPREHQGYCTALCLCTRDTLFGILYVAMFVSVDCVDSI